MRPRARAPKAMAAEFLVARGLTIVARNFRIRRGEIDLIARDGDTLVFVEVRLRRNQNFGGAGASITAAKCARLDRGGAGLSGAARRASRRAASTPCCWTASTRPRIAWERDILSG